MTTQTKDINMISGGVRSYVNVSQYDVGSEIKFALYDNSSAFTPPAGTTVRVEGRKPDGNGFSYSASLSDNVVTVTVTDQMTVLSGEVLCELRLTKDSVDIGTANFILAVEEAPINSNIPISDTEIPAIIELARQEQYNAEAWAQGTRNGVPVSSDDPTYHNNAKYYGGQPAADIDYYEQNGFLSKNIFDGIIEQGTFGGDGLNVASNNRIRSKNYIAVKEGKTYTLKGNATNVLKFSVSFYDEADYATARIGVIAFSNTSLTFSIPTGVKYLRFVIGYASDSNIVPSDVTNVQLEEGSTESDYMQYAPSNIELANSKSDITAIGNNENGITASQAYAQGEHFYKDGKFCTAKTAIASGATFTLNTNYVEGTVADELTVEKKEITTSNANVTLSNSAVKWAHRYGRVVMFKARLTLANNSTGGVNLCTLPFKPIAETYSEPIFDIHYTTAPYAPTGITSYITSNGSLNINGTLNAGTYDVFGTYLCQ